MENATQEAKTDFDSKADEFLSKVETETSADSSPENKAEEGQEQQVDSGAEPAKTEQVKTVEADQTLTPEAKLEKIKELLGDDQDAIDAYIKQKGYHTDPAWQKQREQIEKLKKQAEAGTLSEDERQALAEFNKVRNTPEYIRTSMKAQGYTDAAINSKLTELGHNIQSTPDDDVRLVSEKLNLKLDDLPPEQADGIRANIRDVAKIADVIFNDRFNKTLPSQLKPLQEHLTVNAQKEAGEKAVEGMESMVKKEGILDFEKDIEPELHKFLDANPDALQADVVAEFNRIYHPMVVERLKTGKAKQERDDQRNQNRPNVPMSRSQLSPQKKSGDFDKDAEAFFEAQGIRD